MPVLAVGRSAPAWRTAVLASWLLSTTALLAVPPAHASDPAARPLSPAWFANRIASSPSATTPQANIAAVRQSLVNMQNAAAALGNMAELQAQKRSAAAALQFGNGVGAGALLPSNVGSWQNATAPVQTSSGSRTKVVVTQTASKAVATWSSFNVGANTDLVFDQSAGGSSANSWVILNRVSNPAAVPSQILGTISAQGQVYVIDRNGIIFGNQSQVNVGALLASTADFTNGISGFNSNGIYSASGTNGLLPAFGGSSATDAPVGSAIIVQAGAQITTSAPTSVLNTGGFVMLMAATVQNAGAISTPQGQVALAAGQQFILTQGYSNSGSGDPLATTLGTQIAVNSGGAVSNAGLLTATSGDITMVGHSVTQSGVILSSTTTSQRGTIHLLTDTSDATASVTLAPGSVTEIVPELDDTDTALDSQRASLINTSYINNNSRLSTIPSLNDIAGLADMLDESRIEITSGGTVTFGGNSLTLAQAGQIAVSAPAGRILLVSGAQLDVSGVVGLSLPVSDNILTVNIQTTQLRDSPANTNGPTEPLADANVYVDARNLTTVAASIVDTAVRQYTPGGLLEVSGYVSDVGHTIGEWSTIGGTVTLAGQQVVVQPQAGINLAGGSINYQGGLVQTSWLIGSNGQIYNVATAPGNIAYVGVYDGFSADYTKWGFTNVYVSSLVAPATIADPSYTVGRDAGTLILSTPTAVLDGTISAGVVTGTQQTAARPALPFDTANPSASDPFIALAENVAPIGGTLELGNYGATGLSGAYATDVQLGGGATTGSDASGSVASTRTGTAWLSADLLNNSGLASLQIATTSAIATTGALTLAPGGTIILTASNITLGASLIAPDASITLGNNLLTGPAHIASTSYFTTDGSAAVTLAAGARIDAGGMWNNRAVNPADATGASFIAGGKVTIDSSQGITLAAGSAIAVSGGGAMSASNSLSTGAGGSITLLADDTAAGTASAPLVLDGTLSGYGGTGGGTLSITAPTVRIGGADPTSTSTNTLVVAASLFQTGFSSYVIDGLNGLSVAPGTAVNVLVPTDNIVQAAYTLPTGSDPADAYSLAVNQLFSPNITKATLTQRRGASLTLQSLSTPITSSDSATLSGGAIAIGAGAAITVDPGQTVALQAYNSITIDGDITAHGGTISIVNARSQDGSNNQVPSLYTAGLEVWLGATSRLDVSGIASTATDVLGRPFGVVQAGGTISIGGIGGTAGDGTLRTTDAQVIIRPGATLLADGAHAMIDPAAGQDDLAAGAAFGTGAVDDTTAGGSIILSSYTGIYLDGTMRAAAGGAGAAGGTLSLTLETPVYDITKYSPAAGLLTNRVLTIGQTENALLPSNLQEGQATPQSAFAQSWLGADQVTSGGFGSVVLSNRGLTLFSGDVTLRAAQSITLANGVLADSSPTGKVAIVAPYVEISGDTSVTTTISDVSPLITQSWVPPTDSGTASFTVDADQIDLANDIRLGTGSTITAGSVVTKGGYAGFANTTLRSTGDIRFVAPSNSLTGRSTLFSDGEIALLAAQIYPDSGVQATVVAGYDYDAVATKRKNGTETNPNPLLPDVKLIIGRTTDTLPAPPDSVGGSLTLAGGEVDDDGVVVAPLGTINIGVVTNATALVGFGKFTNVATTRVVLQPDSVISVSANGLTIPYGGTSDGVNYTYDGGAVTSFSPSIALAGRSIAGASGAVLDLQGGGTLTGGGGEMSATVNGVASLISQGFISGRGGSVDILVTPLLSFNAASTAPPTATLASNPVYAIVPSYEAPYAPLTQLDQSASYYGSLPALGEQITIGSGVPGLAAGTYTLLPSYYALLPGAYRVELSPGHYIPQSASDAARPVGYGNYQIGATISVANTDVHTALAVTATLMPASTVASYSQYDQQSYSAFELAQAATYNQVRPILPQDAGTLVLSYTASPLLDQELSFQGTADFDPASGGYGGTLEIVSPATSQLEITGAAGQILPGSVALSASAIDAFGAPRVVIGGKVQYSTGSTPGTNAAPELPGVLLTASSGGVTIDGGAVLTGAEVFLLASSLQSSGGITVSDGAVIDTVGQGAASYDSAGTGLNYDVQRNTALLVSNGQITLAATNLAKAAASGPLTIADGATLVTTGSIVTSTESSVSIGSAAKLGAAYLTLSVPTVNIGSPAAGVPVPSGLDISDAVLARLLDGDPSDGAPALNSLQITASSGVNFYGTVNFSVGNGSSGLQLLTLNTPAIYGQGSASDVALIAVATMVWNGVASTATNASVLPEGVVAGGAGTGQGTLDIETNRLVLGYADGVTPTEAVSLNRTIFGFANVLLQASEKIEFNNTGTLSVYQQQAGVGFTGTGGALTLSAPVITGDSGASLAITAGGALQLIGGGGTPVAQSGQGATLALSAASVEIATAVALNAGSLSVLASTGNIQLDAASLIDVSGPSVVLFDQTHGSNGGSVALESTLGSVVQAAGAIIEVSASAADAGSISITAPDGTTSLAGTLNGAAPTGAAGGSFTLRTFQLGDFAGLNTLLDSGGFTQSRQFDIASGDLTVAGTITAHDIGISASGGSLTITGTLDASGATPGSIVLAAQNALTLASSAVLDAHATVSQTDSTGAVIQASNRADVSLTAQTGELTLQSGATINVANASGETLGTVELYAPRVATNDIAIDASATPVILGAASVALYAMRSYDAANDLVADTVSQGDLAVSDADSTAFIAVAENNSALLARLAGISDLASFHLRPGVTYTDTGDLTVSGDLNLNAMRYQGLGASSALEPGVLTLRAAGDLNIFGSITDGFGTPVGQTGNPDDNGWYLIKGVDPAKQSIVVPTAVSLASGTSFLTNSGATLSYPITIAASTLKANVVVPMAATLTGSYIVGAGGMIATSDISSGGKVLFAQGTLVPGGTKLTNISVAAGAVFPFELHLAGNTIWPAGAPLADFSSTKVTLSAVADLPAGGLIPSGTKLVFAASVKGNLALRTAAAGQQQGLMWATAPLDAAGTLSWSINLVGGANLASANNQAVQAASALGGGGNIVLSDPHYVNAGSKSGQLPALSVIRTGTGDLALVAGGGIAIDSLFGIYTAGAQSPDVAAADELARGTGFDTNPGGANTVLLGTGTGGYDYNATLAGYQAWYPTGGGNVVVSAQGNVTGDVISVQGNGGSIYQSDAVGNWLWRQGGSTGQPTAWWINFGAYVDSTDGTNTLEMVGFSGIGALGGGNVQVSIGGNAGNLTTDSSNQYASHALDVVVASTGQVTDPTTGATSFTGGGDVTLDVAGTINPVNMSNSSNGLGGTLYGVIGDMRGNVTVNAGAIGAVVPSATLIAAGTLVEYISNAYGGPLLLLGDASATLNSAGDLVLGGVIDPTRVTTANTTPWTATIDGTDTDESGGGRTSFSLWDATTSIALNSAGGTLVPTLDISSTLAGSDMNITYPATLKAVAATGGIVYGSIQGSATTDGPALELAPSPVGQLELLAGGGINAAGLAAGLPLAIDISGANPATLTSPTNPAFQGSYEPQPGSVFSIDNTTNAYNFVGYTSLFAFAPDTPTTNLHAADTNPALIYAAGGDIVDFNFGETWRFLNGSSVVSTWYIAAKPALIQASRDILDTGSASLLPVPSTGGNGALEVTRNLILNDRASDASVLSAGRDIYYANVDIAGPGTLEVSAGRNLYQANQGSLYSVGQIVNASSSLSGGAAILLMAGLGDDPPDWATLQALYLGTLASGGNGSTVFTSPSVADGSQTSITYQVSTAGSGDMMTVLASSSAAAPDTISTTVKRDPPPTGSAAACVSGLIICDNHSIPGATPLSTVAQSYDSQLVTWLATNAGFTASSGNTQLVYAAALSTFEAMPLYQRIPFLMQIYNSELSASGEEQTGALLTSDARYTATSAARLGSLVRGKEANAALEPDPAFAVPSTTTDSITLYGASGVSTAGGGGISAFAPGGQLVLGLSSVAPPTTVTGEPAAGLITFGSGEVDISTYSSVLLGQSRIFTTFGGAINIWSEGGDINAGTGSKTTSVYSPPSISYDNYGDITQSPSAATSGAGIATLAPVAGVPAGDVVLVVELGVIDTGEAGIRSSGRTSFTGTVVGNGGVTAAGGSFGGAVVAAPNVGAAVAASSNSASAAASGSNDDDDRRKRRRLPSIITVEVISFGGDSFQ